MGRGWTSELLLAKSLPNRSHHKGCVWAHESRADLEPLRFSTHERSGVGSESGLAGELFSRFFSRIFPLIIFDHLCVLITVGLFVNQYNGWPC